MEMTEPTVIEPTVTDAMTVAMHTKPIIDPIDAATHEQDDVYTPYTPAYFGKTLESGTESHIKWLLISCLMRNIVNRFDAYIFGGAVRDLLLHSRAASKFYHLCANSKINNKDYDNQEILPELSDRFLLPKDIDIFLKKTQFERFKKYLYKRGFYYNEQKNIDMSYINLNLQEGEYELIKAEIIYFDRLNNKSYTINLDVILCNQSKIRIPRMDSDFSVNKLMMSNEGIVSISNDWTFNQIKTHIHEKHAFCDSSVSEKRYEKLNAKGWKITMNYSTFVFKLRVNTEEETCVICLDTLKVGELEVLPKNCKCKYSYCSSCLPFTLKSTQCLMCKKDMCLYKKECDIKMYEKYKILDKE